MLGNDLAALARKNGFNVNIYDLPEFDITCSQDLQRLVETSDVIVNCAAYTAVDKAESDAELCYNVNAKAVGNLGKTAKSADKYVIHISTDFVFGDKHTNPLTEDDATNPLGVYGASKLAGEQLLAASGCRHAVIRVEWTYGEHGNNFIAKIVELAKKLDSIKVVDDQVGSPTPTGAVAQAILCFIKKQPEGIFHFAAKGYASRYDVAKFLLDAICINKPVNPCSSDTFPAPAKRPLNSRLDCSKIDGILDFERPEWDKALNEFLKKIRSKFRH